MGCGRGGGKSDRDSYSQTTLGWGAVHVFKSDSARGVRSSKLHYRQLCLEIRNLNHRRG